eukprot:884169-Pyramimonas_sp.AAC.1
MVLRTILYLAYYDNTTALILISGIERKYDDTYAATTTTTLTPTTNATDTTYTFAFGSSTDLRYKYCPCCH